MIIVMGMLVMVVYSSLVLSSLLVAMMTCSLFSFQPYRLSSVLLIVDNDDDDDYHGRTNVWMPRVKIKKNWLGGKP